MDKETIRMQRLAGVISESEYHFLLEEMKQDESFTSELEKLKDLSLEYVNKYGKTKINHE
jgi:hypothetical protein